MKKIITNKYFISAFLCLISSEVMATAETDYASGVTSYKAGDNIDAVTYFESAREQGMDSVALNYNLASVYYRLGKYGQAKKYFTMLIETEAMRDISDYHLGLIAIKEKDGKLARGHFNAVVASDTDEKLVKLSQKHLDAFTKKENKWNSYLAFNLGYDDNISSVSGDSVLDFDDTFHELYAATDVLLSGRRKDGWLTGASVYGIEYTDTDTNDQYSFSLGLKRTMKLDDWDTTTHLSLAKSTYGGDDFQTITKLDVLARKPISKREKIYLRYQVEDFRSDNILYDYLEGWRQRGKVEYRNYSASNIKRIYYELELNDRGELVTLTDSYDYSPTRHTVRGIYTQIINKRWWLIGDLSYRFSDFEASPTVERQDDQWKLGLTAEYRFDPTLKLTTKYQYTDNTSSVDRYEYDKTIIKIGLSKLF